ncbi:MAG: hypothetical protein KKA07_04580 [Bacteroidetes bacterium]|nr:hypothetical protein [Bacteroidota bacterium]MBU1718328.1 hypothetical protein [Bacteroidota bacterium]
MQKALNNRVLQWVFVVSAIVITISGFQLPFFWDGPYFSGLAIHYFDTNFTSIIPPEEYDTGQFPLFSLYLGLAWSVFGKSLLVSHLAFLPVIIGLAIEFFRFARRFVYYTYLPFAVVLFLADPAIITQSLYMSYDVVEAWFFLFSLNRLLEKKVFSFSFGLLILSMISTRSVLLLPPLFIIYLYRRSDVSVAKRIRESLMLFAPAALFLSLWNIFHYNETGWFLVSPLRSKTHESLGSAAMIPRQAIYILWKLADSGRVFLWLIALVPFFFYSRRTRMTRRKQGVGGILMLSLFFTAIPMIFLKNPIAHRYFLFSFPILIILVVRNLQYLTRFRYSRLIVFILVFVLISGNFWMYPQRFGNAWDTSLKSFPYGKLYQKTIADIHDNQISLKEVASEFPLIINSNKLFIDEGNSCMIDLDDTTMSKVPYILYSNVSNSFSPDEIRILNSNWQPVFSNKDGMIVMTLFRNPDKRN